MCPASSHFFSIVLPRSSSAFSPTTNRAALARLALNTSRIARLRSSAVRRTALCHPKSSIVTANCGAGATLERERKLLFRPIATPVRPSVFVNSRLFIQCSLWIIRKLTEATQYLRRSLAGKLVSVVVLKRLVFGAGSPQNFNDVRVILVRGQTYGGRAIDRFAIYICPTGNQQAHRRHVSLKGSDHHRCNTVIVCHVHAGTPSQ